MSIHDLDPAQIDGMALPESFTSTVFSPGELMRRLGVADVSEFWLAYRAGRIPPAVWLPTDPPIACWDIELVECWIKAGCPVEPSVLAHNLLVIPRLLDCVENAITTTKPESN